MYDIMGDIMYDMMYDNNVINKFVLLLSEIMVT